MLFIAPFAPASLHLPFAGVAKREGGSDTWDDFIPSVTL